MDSFFEIIYLAVLVASAANVFNCIAKVVVELLISDEIPDFYVSSGVVGWCVGHCLTRFDTVLPRQKFCRWRAKNNVMMSSLSAAGSRSSSRLSLKLCSIVSSNTGIGGTPGYDGSCCCVIIFVCKNACESCIGQGYLFV